MIDQNQEILLTEIRRCNRERNRLRRFFQRTGVQAVKHKNVKLVKQVRQDILCWRNKKWEEQFAASSTKDNSLWKIFKLLRNCTTHIHILDHINFYPNKTYALGNVPEKILQIDVMTTIKELKKILNWFPMKRAAGPDHISKKELWYVSRKALIQLTHHVLRFQLLIF